MNNIYKLYLNIKTYNIFWENNIKNINIDIKKQNIVTIEEKIIIQKELAHLNLFVKKY